MNENFIEERAVLSVFEFVHGPEPILVMGKKIKGFGKGYLMFPGGYFEEVDKNDPVKVAKREGEEETSLVGLDNVVAAKIVVNIEEKRLRCVIYIVLFTSWRKILIPNDEFEWLGFLHLSLIFSENNPPLLPGEEIWMEKVFVKGEPTFVEINCGKDRSDVKWVKIRPLHYDDIVNC